MKTNKVIIRAFEAWSKPPAHLAMTHSGNRHFCAYLVAVEATTAGTARQGAPFRFYEAKGQIVLEWLKRVGKVSEEIENEERQRTKATIVLETYPSSSWKEHPMTFAVEAAAHKFMRRVLHEELGGKEGCLPLYEGLFSLDKLKGRETVSPFHKDIEEVESPAPAFDGSNDDFRARRKRKRVAKERRENMRAELSSDETMVRAYHKSRSTMIAGMAVIGFPVDAIGKFTDGESSVKGYAVTDCNMYTTIKTSTKSEEKRIKWMWASSDIEVPTTTAQLMATKLADMTIVGISERDDYRALP